MSHSYIQYLQIIADGTNVLDCPYEIPKYVLDKMKSIYEVFGTDKDSKNVDKYTLVSGTDGQIYHYLSVSGLSYLLFATTDTLGETIKEMCSLIDTKVGYSVAFSRDEKSYIYKVFEMYRVIDEDGNIVNKGLYSDYDDIDVTQYFEKETEEEDKCDWDIQMDTMNESKNRKLLESEVVNQMGKGEEEGYDKEDDQVGL